MATYHRADALGAGSFGSVLKVYNDDGEEFAMKLFLDDEEEDNEDETLNVGALLELSALRLIRDENKHPNIIQLHDVKTAEEDDDEDNVGAGTSGCLGMTMPLYELGSLDGALEQKLPQILQSRANKVNIAHGLLSAVNFLHETCGMMHRDIKADNVMLTDPRGNGMLTPVLIDFSLAKLVNGSLYGQPNTVFANTQTKDALTHTGQIGTATYMAPEVFDSSSEGSYNERSDLWSLGVVLLEMVRGETIQSLKTNQAMTMIQEALAKLPQDKPFPALLRKLLQKNPADRWTARECFEQMSTTLFSKLEEPVPKKVTISLKGALPLEFMSGEDDENTAPKTVKKGKKNKMDPVLQKRIQTIRKLCNELQCEHPMSIQAALTYCQCMLELDEDLDDISSSQTLLDCVVLAHKCFEVSMLDLTDLEETYKSFANWNLDEYRDNEATIFLMMDHCLYPRELIPLE